MATGKCVNIGGGCSKALNKYVVEADKANFVCKECGKPLVSCEGPITDPDCKTVPTGTDTPAKNKSKKKLIIIAGALIVLGIGGTASCFFINRGAPMPESIRLSSNRQKLFEGDADTLKVTNTPINAPATYTWTSSDERIAKVDDNGIVTLTGEGQATILVTVVENPTAKDSCIYTVTSKEKEEYEDEIDKESISSMESEKGRQLEASEKKPLKQEPAGTSGLYLNGRIWEGPTANGKPHGIGVMKFTSNQVIDSRDPNKTMAHKGDYLTGAKYDNGKLIQGQLHRTDGTQKAIVIGQ